jgi:dTDP-4-amino-4,6-dideoxygalactose transaminase
MSLVKVSNAQVRTGHRARGTFGLRVASPHHVGVIPLNDLRRGFADLAPVLLDAATRVIESGYYVHGPEHTAFEREFGDFIGAGGCVGVGNGTDALELALRALAPQGGTVVTVANAAMYTTTAALRAGFQVRYLDVSEDSLLIDVDHLAGSLSDDVSVVVVTHLYGRMADVQRATEICHDRGVLVLEDCAQAAGARRGSRRAGSFGDAAAFSFYPTKNLGAFGDGGAILSPHEAVLQRARQLRQYGWASKYEVALEGGRNSRLDELQAAILRVRLPHLDAWNARRREILQRYHHAAAGPRVRVLPPTGEDHVAHLAVALTDDRATIRAQLAEQGIATDVHYPVPDHRQQVVTGAMRAVPLPVTDWASERIFSLPCFPELTDSEVDHVCAALASL